MSRALQVDHKDHLLALGLVGFMVKDLGFQGLGLRVYGANTWVVSGLPVGRQ